MHELVAPKFEVGVLDELDECDKETPRVRTIDDQPLQQNPAKVF